MRLANFSRQLPLASVIGLVITLLFLALNVHTAFEKQLVGTISPHEWGKYRLAIGAAITQSKYGIGGFVEEDNIESMLMLGA